MQSSCTPCTDLLHAHTHVCILHIYMAPIYHVGFRCCCSLLLPLGLMMLHPRAYVFYYVPAYYSIILRRYSGSTSSSRRGGAGGGWRRPVWCVRLLCIDTQYTYVPCVCVRGAWWAGQRAAAHQWWASYKVRIAQSFIVFITTTTTTTTTWWEGACLSPACLPAALVAASGRQRDGTYFDPSTSDGSFAAGHTNTHTQHNTTPP